MGKLVNDERHIVYRIVSFIIDKMQMPVGWAFDEFAFASFNVAKQITSSLN